MITYFAASKTLDLIVEGYDEYIGVTIISPHCDRIRHMIVNTMGRGLTVYTGKRGFGKTGEVKDVDIIYTVITRLEMNKLNAEIEKIKKKIANAKLLQTIKLLSENDRGWADLYVKTRKGNVKITDIEGGCGYMWDEKKLIWEKCSKSNFHYDIAVVIKKIAEDILKNCECQAIKDKYKASIEKIIKQSHKVSNAKATFEFAKVQLYDEDFEAKINSSKEELPIKDGVLLDLTTGKTRTRVQTDYFNFSLKRSLVPKVSEKIHRFFKDIMCGNDEIIEYLQEALSYGLSGKNNRLIYILHGDGKNGKSAITTLMRFTLEKMFCALDKGVLMKKGRNEEDRHKSAATKELNGIEGKRCAWCDESETNDYINSKMVKILCNERSTIQLKKLYRDDEKTVDLFASVFLSTNPLPNFDSNDKAVIDRLRFIPFNARFFDLNNKMDKKMINNKII